MALSGGNTMKILRLSVLALISLGLLACGSQQKPPRSAADPGDDPRTLMGLGDGSLARKNYDEAAGYYKRSLVLDSGNSLVYNKLGLCYLLVEKLPDAKSAFEQAIAINPTFADARNNLATTLARMGEREQAKEQYGRAAETPGFSTAYTSWYNLGKLQFEDGDFEGAVTSFHHCFELRPDFLPGALGLGMALKSAGRIREACSQFEKVATAFPQDCETVYLLGTCLYDQKAYNEATLKFEKVVELCPGSSTSSKANEYLKVLKGR